MVYPESRMISLNRGKHEKGYGVSFLFGRGCTWRRVSEAARIEAVCFSEMHNFGSRPQQPR